VTTAVQPFSGTHVSDPVHSSFGFAVRYSGISDYRGTLDDVRAALTAGDDGLLLEGAARAESISIQDPPQLRAHVLGPEFFDVERHPEVSFRSSQVDLSDDGSARVEGELTIKGVTRPVVARGTWIEPSPAPGGGSKAGLALETTFDRRDFGFDWQMELPGGGGALDWQVTLTVNLVLARLDEATG
jgi:polyisoprenoid-binding protein YceI